MKKNQFLPIGSIVQLSTHNRKIMICGRQQRKISTGENFDYIGCEYPQGFDGENTFLFHAEEIILVYFIGYQDLDELHQRFQLLEFMKGHNVDENDNELKE